MEYAEVKEWLDRLVHNYNEHHELSKLNESVSVCTTSYGIQLFKGIDIIADVMGFCITEKDEETSQFRYNYSFMYEGVEFFELHEERMSVCTDTHVMSADATVMSEK